MAPEARSRAALGGRESVAARASSGGWRWGTELTAGARLSEKRGGGDRIGKARTEEENIFAVKTRPTRGLDGPTGRFRPTGTARPVGGLG
jgi:hypothetical protein